MFIVLSTTTPWFCMCDNTIIIIILQCIAFIGVYLHQCIVHCVLILCIYLVIDLVAYFFLGQQKCMPYSPYMHAWTTDFRSAPLIIPIWCHSFLLPTPLRPFTLSRLSSTQLLFKQVAMTTTMADYKEKEH